MLHIHTAERATLRRVLLWCTIRITSMANCIVLLKYILPAKFVVSADLDSGAKYQLLLAQFQNLPSLSYSYLHECFAIGDYNDIKIIYPLQLCKQHVCLVSFIRKLLSRMLLANPEMLASGARSHDLHQGVMSFIAQNLVLLNSGFMAIFRLYYS